LGTTASEPIQSKASCHIGNNQEDTGNSTAGMTERYTKFLVNDFADVLKITEGIIVEIDR
jgi:hypothetical protein